MHKLSKEVKILTAEDGCGCRPSPDLVKAVKIHNWAVMKKEWKKYMQVGLLVLI